MEDICSNTSYQDSTFDVIYTVEAVQHFHSITNFARESARLLKYGGNIAVAGCFSNQLNDSLDRKIDFKDIDGLEIHHQLVDFICTMEKANLKLISKHNISEHVFPGYQQWLRQCAESGGVNNAFSFSFYDGYRTGLLDYWVLCFQKSTP